MKKKMFWIIISVILVLFLIVIYLYNIRNQFKLDTEYKYIIHNKLKNPPITNVAVTTYANQYYEIDLENSIIEVREDFMLEGKWDYKRKLISSNYLNVEETNQLTMLLKSVMEEDKTLTYYKYNGDNGNMRLNLSDSYYLVSNKYKADVIMWDSEVVSKFLEIVKLELEPDSF